MKKGIMYLVVACCLFVGCQASTPQEQKIDLLLFVIYQVMVLAYFVQACAHGAFFPLLCIAVLFALVWNGAFVQTWFWFKLNLAMVPVGLLIAMVNGKT